MQRQWGHLSSTTSHMQHLPALQARLANAAQMVEGSGQGSLSTEGRAGFQTGSCLVTAAAQGRRIVQRHPEARLPGIYLVIVGQC